MALIKRLDFSAKNRRNKCSKHLNNCTSNKISRSSISGTKNNLNQQKNNLFSLNSKQLINDQLLIKKQNYGDLSKKRSKNINQVFNNLDEQRFSTNQFCSCCFLDKQSSSSLTSSPSCLRDSSSSPKSTVTHISNNLLYSDQNSQSSESSNFWCSSPSSSENQNLTTDSFLNEEKSNTLNNNLVNYLNNNNNNSTTNRITPTFRSFNQVHQQASKNFQNNQLSFTTDNELPKSYSQFYNKTYHHSFTNHLLNYLNSPNQHFFFVNRLLAQKANSLSNSEKNNLHENINKLPDNCSFRLPTALSISLNNKNHQQKFKKNSPNKFEKKRLVSRIVAKIRAKNFLKMYRNNSTSTSLQSQITLQPNGSFHKLTSNVALAWEDINVYKPIPIVDQLAFRLNTSVLSCDEHNLILKQLNGVINFGQMFAIMGPSGAGKSTLLKCLFGTANVKYDGKLYVQNKQVKAVFITQNEQDHLLMNLTVEEAIYYSSNLKMNKSAENEKIEQLIQQLELTNCRSTLVKSCSGGQKKRIAIAQELVGSIKPRLLFLDEPTSGLDSNVSFVVLSQLQKLCRTHHIAIVATIHQPSFKLVELFDQLYIISKGGKCVFFGQPRNLKSHLKEFEVRCPEGHNPADIAIDYAAINTRLTKEDIIQNKVLEKLASEKKRLKAKNKKKKKLNDLEADSLDKDDDSEDDAESAICKNDSKQRCIVKHYKDNCTKKINNLDQCCNNYCCCTCCGQRDNINKLEELIRFPTAEFYIGRSPPYNLSEQKLCSNEKSQMVVNIESSNGLNFGENRYSNNLMNFTDNFDSFYNQNNILNRYTTSHSTDAIRTFRFNQSISERTAFKHCSVISNTSAVSTMESKIQTVRMIEQAMESNCRSQVAQVKSQVKGGGTQRLREIQKLCENRNSFSFRHTWSLFKRTFTNSILREPKWLMIRIGLHCLVAIVLFSLYDDSIGKEDGCILLDQQEKLPSYMFTRDLSSLRKEDLTAKNVSFLFFNLLFLMFAALMPTVLTFPTEIKVFLNEHRNGWYSTCSYYWAKTITELLIQLPLPYFYCLFMYWSTKQFGLNQLDEALPWSTVPSRFREFAFICVMASFIAQGMGFLIGALFTTNFNISIFVATIVMLFNFLFSGFFVKIKDMGEASLITNLSFIRFSFESIMLSIYGFDRCEMYKHMEMNDILKMKNINVNQTEISNELASYNQIKAQNAELMKIFPVENKVVQAVLYRFEISDPDFNLDIYGLFAHLVLWRLLTYVVLFIKANPATPFSNLFLKLSRFQDLTLKFIKWFCIIQIICFVIGIIIIIIQLNV